MANEKSQKHIKELQPLQRASNMRFYSQDEEVDTRNKQFSPQKKVSIDSDYRADSRLKLSMPPVKTKTPHRLTDSIDLSRQSIIADSDKPVAAKRYKDTTPISKFP
jgi:hypothetical protein